MHYGKSKCAIAHTAMETSKAVEQDPVPLQPSGALLRATPGGTGARVFIEMASQISPRISIPGRPQGVLSLLDSRFQCDHALYHLMQERNRKSLILVGYWRESTAVRLVTFRWETSLQIRGGLSHQRHSTQFETPPANFVGALLRTSALLCQRLWHAQSRGHAPAVTRLKNRRYRTRRQNHLRHRTSRPG